MLNNASTREQWINSQCTRIHRSDASWENGKNAMILSHQFYKSCFRFLSHVKYRLSCYLVPHSWNKILPPKIMLYMSEIICEGSLVINLQSKTVNSWRTSRKVHVNCVFFFFFLNLNVLENWKKMMSVYTAKNIFMWLEGSDCSQVLSRQWYHTCAAALPW